MTARPAVSAPKVDTCNTVIFRFTTQEVENLDFSRFLFLFGVDRPDLTGLEKLRGNVSVLVFDADVPADDIYVSAAGRRFCQAFFSRFPYWAYFFSLQSMSLWKMSLALIENSAVIQFDEAWKTKVVLPDRGLETLVKEHITYAEAINARAGLLDSVQFAAAIRKYFSDLLATYAAR